eukprot:3827326-Amphidinium_carterae.2
MSRFRIGRVPIRMHSKIPGRTGRFGNLVHKPGQSVAPSPEFGWPPRDDLISISNSLDHSSSDKTGNRNASFT